MGLACIVIFMVSNALFGSAEMGFLLPLGFQRYPKGGDQESYSIACSLNVEYGNFKEELECVIEFS